MSCAMRGRSDGEWYKSEHKQMLELGTDISNSITGAYKDYLVIEIWNKK